MIAQQIINGHDGAEIAALDPPVIRHFINATGFPFDPAGDIHVCQIDPAVICPERKLPDQQFLIVFQEDFSAYIHLQVIVGRNFFFCCFHIVLPHFSHISDNNYLHKNARF
jgi:hypothetical protein